MRADRQGYSELVYTYTKWTSRLTGELTRQFWLVSLPFELSGFEPSKLAQLGVIQHLDLSVKKFTGSISWELCQLKVRTWEVYLLS